MRPTGAGAALREARLADIPRLETIRSAVRENRLSDPRLVTPRDHEEHILGAGRTWVCEQDGRIVGFAAANRESRSIWALFVDPVHERRGIGRQLLDRAVDWLWSTGADAIELSTAPATRAERFYLAAGWAPDGHTSRGEILFRLARPPAP